MGDDMHLRKGRDGRKRGATPAAARKIARKLEGKDAEDKRLKALARRKAQGK